MEAGDPMAAIIDRLAVRPGRSAVVAVAGPVAVGKTTLSAALAEVARRRGHAVDVLSTDGFLWPNSVLDERGLAARKGFPETYDLDRLQQVVDDARRGCDPLVVPVYSHERYDVLDEPQTRARPDVLVVEGVVALQRPLADVHVYLDADDALVRSWYVARFQALVEEARADPSSFYAAWADLGPEEVAEVARAVWDAVNGPNGREHIAPTRDRADVVVRKGPGHELLSAEWRDP